MKPLEKKCCDNPKPFLYLRTDTIDYRKYDVYKCQSCKKDVYVRWEREREEVPQVNQGEYFDG